MEAVHIFAARYGKDSYRFCVSPGQGGGFPAIPGIFREPVLSSLGIQQDEQGFLEVNAGKVHFYYDPLSGRFRFRNGVTSFAGSAFPGLYHQPELQFQLDADDQVYGFGGATGDPIHGKRGFELLNRDTMLYGIPGAVYASFPVFIIQNRNRNYGIYLPTSFPLQITFEKADPLSRERILKIRFDIRDSPVPMDWFVFSGSIKNIVQEYTSLTGRPELPPRWALGFHQSRWSYRSPERVLEVAQLFRKHDFPCDAIYLDIDIMEKFQVFTWNRKRFPEPGKMNQELDELGFRTVAIVDPGVSVNDANPVYLSGKTCDAFLSNSEGHPFEGRVWPGKTVFPDFLKESVRDWWAKNHESLFLQGVSGIWNDMNEPVFRVGSSKNPDEEVVFHGSTPHHQVRNLYALYEAKSTRDAFRLFRPGDRPFILSRSGSPGIQRYATLWTGDNHATWEHLRENLNMVLHYGLSGLPFTGADVGGFGSGPGPGGLIRLFRKPELYLRWMELGSLMPFFRVHQAKFSVHMEPWEFQKETLTLARKQVRRRYALLPYLYTLSQEASETGSPLVRHPFYEVENVTRSGDQFFLGSALLVAPVLYPGRDQREVVLPAGEWFDYESGERREGPATLTLGASPGSYPLHVKGGSVLPQARPARNADDTLSGPLYLRVFPAKNISGRLYWDDGLLSPELKLVLQIKGQMDRKGMIQIQLDWQITGKKQKLPELYLSFPGEFSQLLNDQEKPLLPELSPYQNEDSQIPWQNFLIKPQMTGLQFRKTGD